MFKKIGFGMLVVTLLAGVVGVGAALAQESTPFKEALAEVARPALLREGSDGPECPGGPRGPGRTRGEHGDVVAEALGMTGDELRQALADGQTVAELAEARGVALEDVADALVAAHSQRIQQAVEDGRLTQEEADERIAELEARILEGLESGELGGPGGPGGPRTHDQRPRGPRGERGGVVAEALGMTGDELRQALADGQTVAELAEARGVALEDVADALVAAHSQRIQQAVEDGRLTQEEADERIAELEAHILEGLESGELSGPGGPGGMRGGPRGGGFHGPHAPEMQAPAFEG